MYFNYCQYAKMTYFWLTETFPFVAGSITLCHSQQFLQSHVFLQVNFSLQKWLAHPGEIALCLSWKGPPHFSPWWTELYLSASTESIKFLILIPLLSNDDGEDCICQPWRFLLFCQSTLHNLFFFLGIHGEGLYSHMFMWCHGSYRELY